MSKYEPTKIKFTNKHPDIPGNYLYLSRDNLLNLMKITEADILLDIECGYWLSGQWCRIEIEKEEKAQKDEQY